MPSKVLIHNFVGRSPCKPHQHAVAHLRSLGGDAGGRIPLYPGISRHIPDPFFCSRAEVGDGGSVRDPQASVSDVIEAGSSDRLRSTSARDSRASTQASVSESSRLARQIVRSTSARDSRASTLPPSSSRRNRTDPRRNRTDPRPPGKQQNVIEGHHHDQVGGPLNPTWRLRRDHQPGHRLL